MRYTNLRVFEKQLSAQSPDQRSRFFFVAQEDDFERRSAIDRILSFVAPQGALISRFSGAETAARAIMDALDSPALFSPESVVVVDEADKKLFDSLSLLIKKPLSFGYLILGAKSKAGAGFADAHGVILDLLEERPWEREKRRIENLHEKARAAGKRLAPDAALWMIEQLERDAAVLDIEMDKLICFCAHKPVIGKTDVEMICSAGRTHTFWQIADEMVWAKIFRSDAAELRDPAMIHGLFPSLRAQLSIGLKMHDLLIGRVPLSEWGVHFPRMWPKTLEKKAGMVQRLGWNYFRSGLDRLFEIEILAKNSSAPLDVLLDIFRVRLPL